MCRFALHWSGGMLFLGIGVLLYASYKAMNNLKEQEILNKENPIFGIIYLLLHCLYFFEFVLWAVETLETLH